MTLATAEFIRRFLINVLPQGFHRIRHYGLLANGTGADNIAQAAPPADVPAAQPETGDTESRRDRRTRAAHAPVPMLRGPHDHHRELPARFLAALPSGDFHRRDQDRHIMIKIGARQKKDCPSASPALDQR